MDRFYCYIFSNDDDASNGDDGDHDDFDDYKWRTTEKLQLYGAPVVLMVMMMILMITI